MKRTRACREKRVGISRQSLELSGTGNRNVLLESFFRYLWSQGNLDLTQAGTMTKSVREADYWAHSTRGFYEEHAAEYAATTLKLSMRTAMDEFASSLDSGASVVDLGCGGGRDLRALRLRRFSVTGVDWAISIAAIARQYSGCPAVVGDLRSSV